LEIIKKDDIILKVSEMKKILPISLLFVVIDQVVKILVINKMALQQSITIINNFFNITYVRNTGAAWSILSGNVLLLIMISVLALVTIYYYLIKDKDLNKIDIVSYSMLIGGIIGNLIDRIVHGYVIDYLDFKIFNYNFPIFNIADTLIVISIIIIGISLIVGEYREQNRNK
jgi:signal peptidase II